MDRESLPVRGRGTAANPPNRFERIAYQPDPDLDEADQPAAATQFFRDSSRSLIAYNDSPDVGFDASINPYRGCEHGCVYCYARPTHEYLGFSAGLDFETRILVKEDAPDLLRRELASPRWKPQGLAISGVTDAWQPIERKLQLTRRCLEVLVDFRNPVCAISKNHLITRDADLLGELARHEAAAVFLSITSLDADLQRRLEPRASHPQGRLQAIAELASAGVPAGVLVAPVIPGLNDHELPAILEASVAAGARFAGYVMLRLPFAVKDLFARWLEQHFPERKERVLGRIRAVRGGQLSDSRFGSRMRGQGEMARLIEEMFAVTSRRLGIAGRRPRLSTAAFRRPGTQPTLFALE